MRKHRGSRPQAKNRIIKVGLRRGIPEIKLKRTDTTLDLSHSAKRAKEEEKKSLKVAGGQARYIYPHQGRLWGLWLGRIRANGM